MAKKREQDRDGVVTTRWARRGRSGRSMLGASVISLWALLSSIEARIEMFRLESTGLRSVWVLIKLLQTVSKLLEKRKHTWSSEMCAIRYQRCMSHPGCKRDSSVSIQLLTSYKTALSSLIQFIAFYLFTFIWSINCRSYFKIISFLIYLYKIVNIFNFLTISSTNKQTTRFPWLWKTNIKPNNHWISRQSREMMAFHRWNWTRKAGMGRLIRVPSLVLQIWLWRAILTTISKLRIRIKLTSVFWIS